MKASIEAIVKYIPPQNTGFRFLKRAVVYVPIREVGLQILEKKQQRLSFVYETILNLMSFGVNDIEQMAKMLGLDIDIYKEIISQMSLEDIIFVSELSLGLTNKGKHAIQDLKKVTIEKRQLNRIFINQATGEIYDEEPHFLEERPRPSCMCLDSSKIIDVSFFRDRFDALSKLYKKESVNEVIFSSVEEERALFRILEVAYEKTYFTQVVCFVYMSEEDNSLLLSFESDKDSQYMTIALNQIMQNSGESQKLFDNDTRFINTCFLKDDRKHQELNELIALMEKRSKSRAPIEEIESKYYSDRYLLDGEVRDLLIRCDEYKPKHIVIQSPYIKKILEDKDIVEALANSKASKITIGHNPNEPGVKGSLEWLNKKISARSNDNLELKIFCVDAISTKSQIVINPGFVINTIYEKNVDNMGRGMIKETSDISFNQMQIADALLSIE